MKYIFSFIIIMFCLNSAFAAKYNVKINVFSNEKSFPRKAFNFYLDFNREVNLSSLKMTVSGNTKEEIPVYAIPVAKYKALIYFMPHKKMDENSELDYVLNFEDGKWNDKAAGSNELKKNIKRNPNLVPNYSFEKVKKTVERFMTWEGRISIIDWRLQDFSGKYLSLKNIKSTCRSSTKEAFHGSRSLCLSNGKPREIEFNEKTKNVLISGSASTSELIVLRPNTTYKLSFFVKITKQIDNGMNFQGIGVSLSFLDYNKKIVPGGMFGAIYSIGSIPQEEYLNKWIYVEACGVTNADTDFGSISIEGKISGVTYIDMIELRKVENVNFPEIIVGKIK
jgi:hypothetical protein